MKWRYPKEGDTRTRVIFALFPRRCDDGFTYWLEHLLKKQTYTFDMDYHWGWRTTSLVPYTPEDIE